LIGAETFVQQERFQKKTFRPRHILRKKSLVISFEFYQESTQSFFNTKKENSMKTRLL